MIVNEDNTQSEAHFGLVLCKYGIVYEVDPVTQKKMPTCTRINRDSILEDLHFLSAVKYASKESAEIFQQRAQEIDRISDDFLKIVDREPPYDVFISYKRTSDDGSLTQDRNVARKLYFYLREKGFKIFFAEETLKNVAGEKYEPYIFAALSSAPVMILIGSKRDHFEATWVKNEWHRYLVLMNQGLKKTLIPAYFEMDPYHMPGELRNLQAMNAADFTFHEDITEIIRKKIADAKEAVFDTSNIKFQSSINNGSVNAAVVNVESSDSADNLYKAGKTNLDFQDFDKASSVFQKMTDTYPQDYRGWYGLLLAKTLNLQGEILNVSYLEYVKSLVQKLSYLQKDTALVDFNRINNYIVEQSSRVLKKEREKLSKEYKVQSTENKIRTQKRGKSIKRISTIALTAAACLFILLSVYFANAFFSSYPEETHFLYENLTGNYWRGEVAEEVILYDYSYDSLETVFNRKTPHTYQCKGTSFFTGHTEHKPYCYGHPVEYFSDGRVYNTTCTAAHVIYCTNHFFLKVWFVAMIIPFVLGTVCCFLGRTPLTETFDLSQKRQTPSVLKVIPIRSVLCIFLILVLAVSLFCGVLASKIEFPSDDIYLYGFGGEATTVSNAVDYISIHLIYTIVIGLIYLCIGMIPFLVYFLIEKRQAKKQLEYQLKLVKYVI